MTLPLECHSHLPPHHTPLSWYRAHVWVSWDIQQYIQNAVLEYNLENDSMISVCFQGTPFNIMVIQVYTLTKIAEEAEVEQLYEDLLELIPPKIRLFHHRRLECKSKKSRDIWSNRQIWPCSTKWSRAKTNRVVPREGTGHSKYPLPTTQDKTLHMDITRWSYQNQIDYILCRWRWRRSIQSVKTRLGIDCGSDHELLIAKFRLKLKKVGKSTMPFMYDLNQIPMIIQWRWWIDSTD